MMTQRFKSNGQDLAIDTEHGLIFVSEQEFNDVKDRYEVETKTTDDGCYTLKFEIIEDYTDGLTLGRALKDKKIKEPLPEMTFDEALKIVAHAYKHYNEDIKKEIVLAMQ